MRKQNLVTKHLSQRGQGMVEYIIIVALIALAAIAAFSYFGKAVRGQTTQMSAQIAGSRSEEGGNSAREAAANSEDEATANVTLGNYQKRDSTN